MQFNVTYWEHRQVTAVAGKDEVTAALQKYVKGDPSKSHAARARTVLTALAVNFEPADMGIIALALREASFAAPDGTEPDQYDDNTDYTADIRPS